MFFYMRVVTKREQIEEKLCNFRQKLDGTSDVLAILPEDLKELEHFIDGVLYDYDKKVSDLNDKIRKLENENYNLKKKTSRLRQEEVKK